MLRKSVLILMEILAGFVVFAAVALGVLVWRLSSGPVSLDFATPYIEESFARWGDGVTFKVEETLVQWITRERSLALRVRNAQLRDKQGELLAAVPLMGIGLDVPQLFWGKVVPTNIQIIAPRLSVLRQSDGRLSVSHFESRDDNQEKDAPIFSDVLSDPKAGGSDPLSLTRNEQFAEGHAALGLMASLIQERTADSALSYLDEVSVRRAVIRFEDQVRGLKVIAPRADFTLRRDDSGLKGEVSFALDLKNQAIGSSVVTDQKDPGKELLLVQGDFAFDKRRQVVDLEMETHGFRPKIFAPLFDEGMNLADFDLPLDLKLLTSIALDGSVGRTRFELKGGQGSLGITALAIDPLPLRALLAEGSISPASEKLVLDKFAVNFGTPKAAGPQFSLAGSLSDWSGQKGRMTALLAARILEMPVDQLGLYWPEKLATNARKWVTENTRAGLLNDASVKLALKWPPPAEKAQDDPGLKEKAAPETAKGKGRTLLSEIVTCMTEQRPELRSLEGAIRYEGLDVHYYRPLPPVKNVKGTALLYSDGLTFFPEAGSLEGLTVTPSYVVIEGLQSDQEVISIQTAIEGDLPSALGVLDHPGFGLVAKLGLDAAQMQGQSKTLLDISFPLRQDLKLEEIDLSAESEIKDASLKAIFQGKDATESDLALRINMQEMDVKGRLSLAGIPLSLDWQENFTAQAPFKTLLSLEAPKVLPHDLKKVFAIKSIPWVEGPFSLNVQYKDDFDQKAEVALAADFQDATIALDGLAWSKAKGESAHLRALLSLQKGQLRSLDHFDLMAPELMARGAVSFAGAKPEKIELEKLRIAQTSLQGVEVVLGEVPSVVIAGGVLDATPFLKRDRNPAVEKGEETAVTEKTTPPFRLEAKALERLITSQESSFEGVELILDKRPEGWREIFFRGRIAKSLQSDPKRAPNWKGLDPKTLDLVSLHYHPKAIEGAGKPDSAAQILRLQTNDLGGMLRAAASFDSIQGGRLLVTGEAENYRKDSALKGVITGKSIRFVDAPILAKLLSFASLTGPLEALSEEGIIFNALTGGFTLKNSVFSSDDLRLYGRSIGLTGKGWVDYQSNRLDVTGTLVPAYTINRILGGIPLFGTLLTGGEGGGVVAFNYGLFGARDDPEVSINPLSALALGFLHRLIPQQGEEIPEKGLTEAKKKEKQAAEKAAQEEATKALPE